MLPQKFKNSLMNDWKEPFQSETEKSTRIYFNFLKHKLIKLKISDTEVFGYLEKVIESETVNLLSIKSLLKQYPFQFSNQYNIDEFSRKLLDGRLLENSQLVNHPRKKVIKRIIKYLGPYFPFQEDSHTLETYQDFFRDKGESVVIDYELNNNIDPTELLPILGDSWNNLQILLSRYIDMFPGDENIKNPHLQILVRKEKSRLCPARRKRV